MYVETKWNCKKCMCLSETLTWYGAQCLCFQNLVYINIRIIAVPTLFRKPFTLDCKGHTASSSIVKFSRLTHIKYTSGQYNRDLIGIKKNSDFFALQLWPMTISEFKFKPRLFLLWYILVKYRCCKSENILLVVSYNIWRVALYI